MNSPKSTYFEFLTVKQKGDGRRISRLFLRRGSCARVVSWLQLLFFFSGGGDCVSNCQTRDLCWAKLTRGFCVPRSHSLLFPASNFVKENQNWEEGGFFSGQKIIPWLQTPFTTETITIFLLILPKIRFFPKYSKWFQNLFLGWDQKLMGAWIRRTRKPLPWIHTVWKSPKMSHFNFNAQKLQNYTCRSV